MELGPLVGRIVGSPLVGPLADRGVMRDISLPLPEPPAASDPGAKGFSGFAEMLKQAVRQVDEGQHQADRAARDFAVGDAKSIHDTILTLEHADLQLRLLSQIRNKGIEAYKEIMQMPL